MMHCMLKQVFIFAVVVVIIVFVVIVVVIVIVIVIFGYPIDTNGLYEWCPVAT